MFFRRWRNYRSNEKIVTLILLMIFFNIVITSKSNGQLLNKKRIGKHIWLNKEKKMFLYETSEIPQRFRNIIFRIKNFYSKYNRFPHRLSDLQSENELISSNIRNLNIGSWRYVFRHIDPIDKVIVIHATFYKKNVFGLIYEIECYYSYSNQITDGLQKEFFLLGYNYNWREQDILKRLFNYEYDDSIYIKFGNVRFFGEKEGKLFLEALKLYYQFLFKFYK